MKNLLWQGEEQRGLAKLYISLSLTGTGAITIILEIDQFRKLDYQTNLNF